MPETKGSVAALAMKERLRLEVEAVDLLKKAIKANRASGLMGAMNRVAELGMDPEPAEMEDARVSMSKLGEQSAALQLLQTALNEADIPGIDSAMKKIEKMNLGDEPEVLEAKALKKKLVKQNKAAESMEAATAARDRDALKALLAEAEALGLAKRFSKQLKAATAVVDLMDLEDQLCKALDAAFAAGDDEAFEEAAAKAEAAGCAPHVAELAEGHRATQRNRRAIISKISEALEAEEQDKDLIQALIDEAVSAGCEGNSNGCDALEGVAQIVRRRQVARAYACH
jgi:hypothetical protein